MLGSGFLLRIRGRITTLLVNRIMKERRSGLSRVMFSQNGNLLVPIRCYGFMESVGV